MWPWHIQSRATRRFPQGVPRARKGPLAYDQRRRAPNAAIWRAILSGFPDRQGHRQARPVRGAELRRAGTAPGRARQPRASRRSAGTCSSAALRRTRRRISARSSARRSTSSSPYYEQCRQARDLPSIPGAVIISCDEPLKFEPVAGRSLARHPEGARARRHPARDRRTAPPARAARRHRAVRRRELHGAGRHLRSAAGRSRRPDVRHDQREAHATERVASRVALRPAALSRREPRRGARRRPRARASARSRRCTARSSCSASGAAASRRRRSRRN